MEPLRITKEEVKRRLDAGEHIVFLDTRSEEAWSNAELQIPQSRRIPPDAVEQRLDEIPRDGLIVTYCT
jgi:rhodanese-related sulfurtransferase